MDHDIAVPAANPLLRDIEAAVGAGLAGTGISMGMRAVLEAIYRNGPMSAAEMGERLRLKPAFVGRMAAAAVKMELLEALPNPAHRNAHFFQITRKGRMAVLRIRDGESRYLKNIPRDDEPAGPEGTHARIHKALDLFFAGAGSNPRGENEN